MKKVNVKIIIAVAAAIVLIIGCVTMAFALQGRETDEITEQKAKEIAFSHAGIQESEVSALRITRGTENGTAVYEVEFNAGGREYDYDIRMSDGDIVSSSYEAIREGQAAPAQAENTEPQTQAAAAGDQAPGQSGGNSGAGSSGAAQSAGTGSGGTAVTADQAKAIALEHAGVSEADARFVRVESDYDDGVAVYEVEFYAGNREYDYDIARDSGKILKYDHDIENFTAGGGNSGSGSAQVSVSLEQAKSLALAKVNGATEKNIRIELDWDDGRPVYEGEIYYNYTEYEFEIDANTGTFLEWGRD